MQTGWNDMNIPGQPAVPNYGLRTPQNLPYQTPFWMRQQQDQLGLQRQQIGNQMLGQMSGQMAGNFSANRFPLSPIPAPHYVGTGGVYNQGQIDAQSNLQRANLQQQAAGSTQGYVSSLASRGFSPQGSPLMDFYGQSALMRANAGAASNETNLNFNAAQANRDATLKAQGVNAGMYGSYTDALSRLADVQMRGQLQGSQQRFDLLRSLLG